MKKDYDEYVTPQNTPRFRERRILYLASMGMLTANLAMMALLAPDIRRVSVIGALLAAGLGAARYFDARKVMWTWWYLMTGFLGNILLTAALIFCSGAYWYFWVLAAEVLGCALAAYLVLRRKR